MTLQEGRVDPAPRWLRAWRAEGLRLRSLRSQWALIVIAVAGALALGVGQIVALPSDAAPARVVRAAVSGAEVSPFFLGLGAALFAASDLSSRQFALTLLQMNHRALVFAAKVSVLVVTGLVTGFGAIALMTPFAVIRGGSFSGPLLLDWLVLPALHLAFVLLGAAIGMIARSLVAAVFVYLAVVWALPLVVAIAGIWAPALSGPVLQFAPVTLTAAMLEPATRLTAVLRFAALDVALLSFGFLRVNRWTLR